MIHIKELFRLQNLRRLRLIAGEAGLERTVTAAVLFEYDPSRMQLPDFYKGDLVVTTLAYARGDAALVADSLIALIDQGIAGLLVKTAYFDELPRSVTELAQRLGTPIFLFDETYIEEVIIEVTDLIRGKRHFSGYEKEIDALMRGGLTDEQVREHVARIDPLGSPAYRAAALFPLRRMPELDEQIYALQCADEEIARRYAFMQWRRMLIVLCRTELGTKETGEDAAAALDVLLHRAGVDRASIVVGMSGMRTDREAIGGALCEAAYAARAARIRGTQQLNAKDLGMYAYLLPLAESGFARAWCAKSLRVIREYDAANKANLEATARAYIDARMEISAAAKELFQHPNTVRYRLGKIQRLMQMEDSAMFIPMLAVTMELAAILEDETK